MRSMATGLKHRFDLPRSLFEGGDDTRQIIGGPQSWSYGSEPEADGDDLVMHARHLYDGLKLACGLPGVATTRGSIIIADSQRQRICTRIAELLNQLLQGGRVIITGVGTCHGS